MKRGQLSSRLGFTLVELMTAMAAGMIVLGVLGSGSIAVYKCFAGTDHYLRRSNDGVRLLDYVARDLRRAVRVGKLAGGTNTAIKNFTEFTVTDTVVLTINVPDYYASNVPDNLLGSTFKTTRYPRAMLNTAAAYNGGSLGLLRGVVPWSEAVTTVAGLETTRFAPAAAGTGEIQIRYYRGKRSLTDQTECFFRAEYPASSNTPTSTVEIAEEVLTASSATELKITDAKPGDSGTAFRVQSSFVSRYRLGNASPAGTEQVIDVTLRNRRRD